MRRRRRREAAAHDDEGSAAAKKKSSCGKNRARIRYSRKIVFSRIYRSGARRKYIQHSFSCKGSQKQWSIIPEPEESENAQRDAF